MNNPEKSFRKRFAESSKKWLSSLKEKKYLECTAKAN
jgi:hypothetical protein